MHECEICLLLACILDRQFGGVISIESVQRAQAEANQGGGVGGGEGLYHPALLPGRRFRNLLGCVASPEREIFP